MLFENEYRDRLNIVREMVGNRLDDNASDMLRSTQAFLYDILDVVSPTCITSSKITQKVVISAMAVDWNGSNPAPLSWIAVNISRPNISDHFFVRVVPNKNVEHSSTYDAIYEGLTSLFGLVNNPNIPVEIHCDDQLVVRQMNNEISTRDKALLNKQESVTSLIKELPVEVTVKWQPAVSTATMKTARNTLSKIRNNYINQEKRKC
jgi:hypothetical protein